MSQTPWSFSEQSLENSSTFLQISVLSLKFETHLPCSAFLLLNVWAEHLISLSFSVFPCPRTIIQSTWWDYCETSVKSSLRESSAWQLTQKEGTEQMPAGWHLLLQGSICFLPRKLNPSLWGFLFLWQATRFSLAPVKDQLNHSQLVKIFHIKKEFQMLLWDCRIWCHIWAKQKRALLKALILGPIGNGNPLRYSCLETPTDRGA